MSQESPKRNVEELLASGPPTEWYIGYGRTDTGITGVWYSRIFNRLADGKVFEDFADWCHFGAGLHAGLGVNVSRRVQRILDRTTSTITQLTGFPPEDIVEKKQKLLQAFEGQTTAPFQLYLVEPIVVPAQPPPFEWFIGFARRDEGIVRVSFSDRFSDMDEGEVGKQNHRWIHYHGNPVTDKNEDVRHQAMEITEQAGHYVKAITGYFPLDLVERREWLQEVYAGQQEAPFEIEYVD